MRFLSLPLFIFLFFNKNYGGMQHRTCRLEHREVLLVADLQRGDPVLAEGLMEIRPALLVSAGESEECNDPADLSHPETCG